jgi:hypothetical protein
MSLDPRLAYTGGFMWWEKKLRGVLRHLATERFAGSYLKAMQHLSCRMAAIELVPYHSVSFGADHLLETMPSAQAVRKFISEVLEPRARARDITLIVTRKAKVFDLRERGSIVLYEGTHARGASLSETSRGGRAIIDRIGLHPVWMTAA